MNNKPRVSIIMPVYNAVQYIEEAMDSILNQPFEEYEFIVVDDCSNDGTMEKVRSYKDSRIRVLVNSENRGVAFSRNRAVNESRGEYIALMDHDDVSMRTRLCKEVEFLDQNPEYGVVAGRTQLIDEKGNILKETNKAYYDPEYIKAIFLFRNVFSNSEVMFRKELAVKHNIYYEDHCFGMEDFKFWIQMSKITKMIMLDELFLRHRIHDSSISSMVFDKQGMQRRMKYEEMQEYSWGLSGINVSRECAEIIHKYIVEEKWESRVGWKEVREVYQAMQTFVGCSGHLDNNDKIKLYCRGQLLYYMTKIEDFWEDKRYEKETVIF